MEIQQPEEICTEEPVEKCRMVTEEVCHKEPQTTCVKMPKQEARQECQNIPREVRLDPDPLGFDRVSQVCVDAQREECQPVTVTKCYDVEQDQCHNVCHDVYWCKVCNVP